MNDSHNPMTEPIIDAEVTSPNSSSTRRYIFSDSLISNVANYSETTADVAKSIDFSEYVATIEDEESLKVYLRKSEADRPLNCCYFCCCGIVLGFCNCCFQSAFDITRICCCRCFIPPKRQSWNRKFDVGVCILSNTMHNVYPHKKSVPVVRFMADHELHPWLPFFPSGIGRKKSQKSEELSAKMKFEWVFPKKEGPPNFQLESTLKRRFILYLHGGGFIIGGPGTHRLLVYEMCRATGATFLVIDYKRSPEHQHPVPVNDAVTAYQWLCSKVDSSQVVVSGDSAGGALAIMTLVRARDENLPRARGGVLLSPWVDLFENETVSCIQNSHVDYIPVHLIPFAGQMYIDPPDSRVSPVNLDLRSLPPLLVEVGGSEVLCDTILKFVARAKRAGIKIECNKYDDMVHVFQLLTLTEQPETRQSMRNIAAFLDKIFEDDVESQLIVQTSEMIESADITMTMSPSAATVVKKHEGRSYDPVLTDTTQPIEIQEEKNSNELDIRDAIEPETSAPIADAMPQTNNHDASIN